MQSNGLISVIRTLLCRKQRLRGSYADFKRYRTDTNDVERSSRPNSAIAPKNTKNLHKIVLANRKLKLAEQAEELKISEGSVFTILHEHLSVRKLPHQPNSPDLAKSDNWMFADLKRKLQRKRFGSNEELISEIELYLKVKDKSFSKKGIRIVWEALESISP